MTDVLVLVDARSPCPSPFSDLKPLLSILNPLLSQLLIAFPSLVPLVCPSFFFNRLRRRRCP
jgi:hypothetical protein